MKKVAVIVGSLRKDSINRKLARAMAKRLQGKAEFHFVELSDVPMYNEDLWEKVPESVTRLKSEIAGSDAVLFVTPEYNRSIPAVLKNAIDWASRPYGDNSWKGKKAAIVGSTPGNLGTAVAQSHLRSIVGPLGLQLLSDEVYYTHKEGVIDESDEVTEERTAKFLDKFLASFVRFIG
jgi:chromate reductase